MIELGLQPQIAQESSVKFLPAFFVDVVELGQEFQRGEIPLHMTFFPPLGASFRPEYAAAMRRLLNPLPPIQAQVGESDYYGDDRDIHVKTIVPNNRLKVAHRRIVASLGHLPHEPKYRLPYNPHISIDEGDDRIKTGSEIEMGGLSIIEKDTQSQVWIVMAKIGLKGTA